MILWKVTPAMEEMLMVFLASYAGATSMSYILRDQFVWPAGEGKYLEPTEVQVHGSKCCSSLQGKTLFNLLAC